MPPPDDALRLEHIRRHAGEAIAMTEGLDRAALDEDRKLELALVRLLEIIGEAATKLTDECRASIPEIDWRAIRGMRNRIVHNYDNVDLDVVWAIIRFDLPGLIDAVDQHRNRGA
jgi:uncharacterized protein with HEPN domain